MKLNIRKLLTNNNKLKLFKKLNVLTLTAALSTTLVGCSTQNKHSSKDDYSIEKMEEYNDVLVEINYENWNQKIKEEECLFFTYDSTAYCFSVIRNDGKNVLYIKNIEGYISSCYLETYINIPKANEDEKIVVNVDYKDRTLEAHTEKLEKENTK